MTDLAQLGPVTEHALLQVRPGHEEDFERALAQARPLIASTPGFRGLQLKRSVESPSTYLLLVEWDSVEAHTVGFRGSDRYRAWRDLLHHFYDPFPVVEHFVSLDSDPTVVPISVGAPSAEVRAWLGAQDRTALYSTSVTLAEVDHGIKRLPDGRRKDLQ